MRRFLISTVFLLVVSPACAEVWTVREGVCGEWQARFNVQQEQSGVWVGQVDGVQIGGPCTKPTGETMQSEVRALITGQNLFAVRDTGGTVCTYFAQIGDDHGRGFRLCEGQGERLGFAIRFRSQMDSQ